MKTGMSNPEMVAVAMSGSPNSWACLAEIPVKPTLRDPRGLGEANVWSDPNGDHGRLAGRLGAIVALDAGEASVLTEKGPVPAGSG